MCDTHSLDCQNIFILPFSTIFLDRDIGCCRARDNDDDDKMYKRIKQIHNVDINSRREKKESTLSKFDPIWQWFHRRFLLIIQKYLPNLFSNLFTQEDKKLACYRSLSLAGFNFVSLPFFPLSLHGKWVTQDTIVRPLFTSTKVHIFLFLCHDHDEGVIWELSLWKEFIRAWQLYYYSLQFDLEFIFSPLLP